MSVQRAFGTVLLVISTMLARGVYGIRIRQQIGSLQASRLAQVSPLGMFMVEKLQEELGDQLSPLPYADVALDETILPCAYERRVLSAEHNDIQVNITSRIDFEFAPASEPATIDIINSTARVDTRSSTWTTDSFQYRGKSNASLANFGHGTWSGFISGIDSEDFTDVRGRIGEKREERDVTIDVATTYICPAKTLCRVETWTYTASIRGISTLVPIVDAQCYEAWARKNYVGFPLDYGKDNVDFKAGGDWTYVYYAFRRLLRFNSQIMHNNLSIPSVHEQVPQWSKFGAPYYTISKFEGVKAIEAKKKGLSPKQETTQASSDYFQVLPTYFEDDVWWADEEKYEINFSKRVRDVIRIPTLHYDGNPIRTQVMLEIPIPQFKPRPARKDRKSDKVKREAKSAADDELSREDFRRRGIKVKLLWTDACKQMSRKEDRYDCGWERSR
ncbi:hypothetical protein XA68_18123 [Ophiocordyceps unilateralis]|uniref:Uncharacterized protein n=1 Tax=Ophiocordyceps unilateralis TaxID=268505 RepID=A0A2A9P3Q1_OPHUN|nr:hypothetical protein XA68_18123 [Ophiocordyceps unilateralis]